MGRLGVRKALVCLCLLENEIDLPLQFSDHRVVCHDGALAWGYARGSRVLDITSSEKRSRGTQPREQLN